MEYADTVVQSVADRSDLVVAGALLGDFTGTASCARIHVQPLVLVAAMVSVAGSSSTLVDDRRLREERLRGRLLPRRPTRARRRGEAQRTGRGFEGAAGALAAEASRRTCQRDTSLQRPPVPSRLGHADARERLNLEPDEIDGGHYITSAARRAGQPARGIRRDHSMTATCNGQGAATQARRLAPSPISVPLDDYPPVALNELNLRGAGVSTIIRRWNPRSVGRRRGRPSGNGRYARPQTSTSVVANGRSS